METELWGAILVLLEGCLHCGKGFPINIYVKYLLNYAKIYLRLSWAIISFLKLILYYYKTLREIELPNRFVESKQTLSKAKSPLYTDYCVFFAVISLFAHTMMKIIPSKRKKSTFWFFCSTVFHKILTIFEQYSTEKALYSIFMLNFILFFIIYILWKWIDKIGKLSKKYCKCIYFLSLE